MTQPTDPTFPIDDLTAPYTSAADEIDPASTDDEEEEEGDGSEGKSGDSRKYKVVLDPLLDFEDDAALTDEENASKTLEKLGVAPMGFLVAGASAFASENDLSRKVFMADVATVNKEINIRDIAHSDLFQRLDSKQAERRSIFGIKTLDEIVTGAIGAAGAAIKFVSQSIGNAVKEKREEKKLSRLAQNFEDGKEDYALDSEDYSVSRSSLEAADFPVQNDQGDDMASVERERVYDDLARQTQIDLDSGKISFAAAFNTLADIILLSRQPVRTLQLSGEMTFDAEAPGIDKELNPMGG